MEIEEKKETNVIFIKDNVLWRLEERVQGFCGRAGIELVNIQYANHWLNGHIAIITYKQKWLVKKITNNNYVK